MLLSAKSRIWTIWERFGDDLGAIFGGILVSFGACCERLAQELRATCELLASDLRPACERFTNNLQGRRAYYSDRHNNALLVDQRAAQHTRPILVYIYNLVLQYLAHRIIIFET